MKKSKLCQLLDKLTEEEWERCKELVSSPFFNKQENCKHLLTYLHSMYIKDKWMTLNKETTMDYLLPNHPKPYPYLRVIMSQLTQLVEQFFIQQELEKRKLYQESFLRNRYIEKGLFTYFDQAEKKSKRREEDLATKKILRKGKDYYLDQYFIAVDNFKCLHIRQARNISTHSTTNVLHALDEFYLVNRLHLMNSNLSIQRTMKVSEPLTFSKQIEEIASTKHFKNNQLLQSYLFVYKLFFQPNDNQWLIRIQEQVENQSLNIPRAELNEFYTILINHYIRKSSQGESHYPKVLNLYKLMAQYDFLSIGEYITEARFKNVVTLGCLFQEFDWTHNFIESYRERLPPQTRESVYHFNMGAMYFFQKKYPNAQMHLSQVEAFDIFYARDVRSLRLRIYYETGEFFAIEQAAPSFKDFIRKQKRFSTAFKQSYLRFISVLVKLAKYAQKYRPKEKYREQLLQRVNKYPSIYHKKWLIEKIQDL